MQATDILSQEHRLIERVLSHLAELASWPGKATPERLGNILAFLREYADQIHHGKEENVLFAAMNEHGFPMDEGPLAVMMHEHDEGRRLIAKLGQAQETPRPWPPEAAAGFQAAARGYVSLLRMHISKEDNVLYRLADAQLPAAAKDDVNRRCSELDLEHARRRQHMEQLASELGSSGAAQP